MVLPARLGENPIGLNPGVPFSPAFDDVYHSAKGAWEQAQHVFLTGNNLPERWQGRERFVILETGFGLGNNFLATWAAWLADPHRCKHLFFVSIEKHPLTSKDLCEVHSKTNNPIHQALFNQLLQAWPPLTPGIHLLEFAGVTLMLGFGDVQELMPKLNMSVHAFYLDGFSPAKNPAMWDERWLSRLNRLAASDATAATWSVASSVCDALRKASFNVQKMPGFGGKRHMLQAVYRPRHVHMPFTAGLWPEPLAENKTAFIVGGGLAGCASAWALSQAGWRVTLIEQHPHVAMEASGNLGGLFHSIVHATENVYTRLHRAAALYTAKVVRPWIQQGIVQGQCDGLLRLTTDLSDQQAQALLHNNPWLGQQVAWLTQAEAKQFSQVPTESGGWCFLQGGWLSPADYARALLEAAECNGELIKITSQTVEEIVTCPDSGQWQALDAQGQCIAQAGSAVLCNSHYLSNFLLSSGFTLPEHALTVQKIRGQISHIHLPSVSLSGIHLPKYPLAGEGYGFRMPNDYLVFGATAQANDEDMTVRPVDTKINIMKAIGLGILPTTALEHNFDETVQGRTGWRASTPDRLPLIGAWPSLKDSGQAKDHEKIRRVARLRTDKGGLFVFSGLGSRGITWAALGARLLSHWMTGSPCPVENDLRDALDPARFMVRHFRNRERK